MMYRNLKLEAHKRSELTSPIPKVTKYSYLAKATVISKTLESKF